MAADGGPGAETLRFTPHPPSPTHFPICDPLTASILQELAKISDFSLELPRLGIEERLAVMQAMIEANAPRGREPIWRKFQKFARMCMARGWRSLPATPDSLYAYVLFLKAEGRVSVASAGGYLSTVSTV